MARQGTGEGGRTPLRRLPAPPVQCSMRVQWALSPRPASPSPRLSPQHTRHREHASYDGADGRQEFVQLLGLLRDHDLGGTKGERGGGWAGWAGAGGVGRGGAESHSTAGLCLAGKPTKPINLTHQTSQSTSQSTDPPISQPNRRRTWMGLILYVNLADTWFSPGSGPMPGPALGRLAGLAAARGGAGLDRADGARCGWRGSRGRLGCCCMLLRLQTVWLQFEHRPPHQRGSKSKTRASLGAQALTPPAHRWCTGATARCTRRRQTAAPGGCAAQWWSAPPGERNRWWWGWGGGEVGRHLFDVKREL